MLCKACIQEKPPDHFYLRQRSTKYGKSRASYSTKCKICSNEERAIYRANNKEKCDLADTNSRLKRSYGIDIHQYNQLFKEQNGSCKCCNRHQSEFKKGLVVDHCHATNIVRGLLCTPCNLALGYVKDDIKVLNNLIKYLNNSSELAAKSNVLAIKSVTKVG